MAETNHALPSGSRLAEPAALATVLAVTTIAYWRVMDGEFQFDDELGIVRNAWGIKSLGGYISGPFLDAWITGRRPVMYLTVALNYWHAQLAPATYHATNLLVHLAATVLVWALVRRLARLAGAGEAPLAAVGIAAVFAVHPLNSQAVAYVSQRAESLASVFYLATVLLLLVAEEQPGRARRGVAWAGAFVAFVAGAGTKGIVVTAPVAYGLLSALVPRGRLDVRAWRGRAILAGPLVIAAALSAARLLLAARGRADIGFGVPGLDPGRYAMTQAGVVVEYARMLAWPSGLAVDHGWPVATALRSTRVLVPAGLLAAAVVGAVVAIAHGQRREGGRAACCRLAGVGVLWFLLILAPTSSIVPLADLMVDHRPYLASVGLFGAAAGALAWALWNVASRRVVVWVAAAVAALVLALAVALHARNAVWETREALWRDCVEKAPRNPRAHLSLGYALGKRGLDEEELASDRRALELCGACVQRPEISRNIAAALLRLGRRAEAARTLEVALLSGRDPELLNNLAIIRLDEGRPELARAIAEEGLARAGETDRAADMPLPRRGNLLNTLGEALLATGDADGALREFQAAVAIDPDVAVRHWNVAAAASQTGDLRAACAAIDRYTALVQDPVERAEASRQATQLGCAK